MKILKLLPLFVVGIALMMNCSKQNLDPEVQTPPKDLQGNGAPSGPHYNLNIIGVQNEKDMDAANSNGHVIFVPLEGKIKILLSEGDYAVLDKNGTDGEAAFQLPNPDPDGDGTTVYSVWARALGKPGGKATIVTAAYTEDGELVYSMINLEVERGHGQQTFTNVSKELLYIYIAEEILVDPDGEPASGDEYTIKAGRYPLFADELEDFFWEYDNNHLKLLQLRFYEVPTTVPDLGGL